jgi:hypothetical protein
MAADVDCHRAVDGYTVTLTPPPRNPLMPVPAVIIGCAPPFATIIKNRFGTEGVSYDSRGFVKRSTENIKMKSGGSGSTDRPELKDDVLWTDGHGSEEALALDGGNITVATTIHQNDRPGALPGTNSGMYRNRPSLQPSRTNPACPEDL